MSEKKRTAEDVVMEYQMLMEESANLSNQFNGEAITHSDLKLLFAELATLTASRDAWKADAERLAKYWMTLFASKTRFGYECIFCKQPVTIKGSHFVCEHHTPDCPIELHRKLEFDEALANEPIKSKSVIRRLESMTGYESEEK